MAETLIGIDLGTTVLKAAAFDRATGRLLGSATETAEVFSPSSEKREQDPRAILAALGRCLRGLRGRIGAAAWKRVAGMGLASQGGSTLVACRETGEPLTRMILWSDKRCPEATARVERMKPDGYWLPRSFIDGPAPGLGRLSWWREAQPKLFREGNVYAGAGDLLYFHLTGLWRQDAGHAVQVGWYNWKTGALDPQVAELLGIPPGMMPPLRAGHACNPMRSEASRAYGIPRGIPVAGPYMDHEAGFLAVADSAQKPLQCSLGTAWVANARLPRTAERDAGVQLVLPDPLGRGRFFVMPIATGNIAWNWALSALIEGGPGNRLAAAAEIFEAELLPPPGLSSLPFPNSPNPLDPRRHGAAGFMGMGTHTTRADMLRAVAAGLACELVRAAKDAGALRRTRSVVIAGGAAQAEYFQKLFAALFAPKPVYRLADKSFSGARGALYAIDPACCRSRLRKVRLPGKALCRRIGECASNYQNLYHAVFTG